MEELKFEWDEEKNTKNIAKHGLDFNEAKTVFFDANAILFDDPDHSMDEDRFLIIGLSDTEKLLLVSHCYRLGDTIRIISARKATKSESSFYTNYNGG